MPYFQRLIDLLIAAPQRARPDGTIALTHAEAAVFQACDFPTAVPGWWPVPPIPAHVPLSDYLFRVVPQLKRQTSGPPLRLRRLPLQTMATACYLEYAAS